MPKIIVWDLRYVYLNIVEKAEFTKKDLILAKSDYLKIRTKKHIIVRIWL